jgi:NhaA family Na+:H+ antiporter
MVVPALIYLSVNAGGDGASGWGIPMATDIAFALGLLALVGSRIPSTLRVFLLALAIVDDIGAILVIAIFYTEGLQPEYLVLAAALLALVYGMNRAGVSNFVPYFLVGFLAWFAVYESGVHATIAGVALGLMTPAGTRPDGSSPLNQLEHGLHPLTSYLIVPLFAFMNAGVSLAGDTFSDSATASITIGIVLGLLIGKPLGILLSSWLTVRLRVATLPEGVAWPHMLGVGMLGGVGFTVALFINGLAFDSATAIDQGKVGILVGSFAAGAVGLATLLRVTRAQCDPTPD